MKKQITTTPEEQFSGVLQQIQAAKAQAFQQVNKTLVQLYWNIGAYVSQQVDSAHWGKNTVEQLAAFIQQKEPNVSGFTASNIWRMKQFYETYADNPKLASLGRELSWTHNRRIMSLKTAEEREFYLLICNQKKYSVRELERLIKSGSFERTMLADEKLSPVVAGLPQSAEGVFKDSYVFEFLDLPIPYKEANNQLKAAHIC